MLIHAMMYLEGQTNCLRTAEYWHENVAHQRLVDFLNWGKCDLNSLNHNRFHHLLPLAVKENSQEDFQIIKIGNEEVFYHAFEAEVPSLSFLGKCRFVVIQDEPGSLNQEHMRILITDIEKLSIEQIVLIYLRRWKQETYHQILKDRLGIKRYKHRRLKAIMRFMELGDLASNCTQLPDSFLEYVRLKQGSKGERDF